MKTRKKFKAIGAGFHLHRIVRRWFGQGFADGCGCKDTIRKMNRNGPAWCRKNIDDIVATMRIEATKRGWWKHIVSMPGMRKPLVWIVQEAIRRAEGDANRS